jgi:hypothetical protein
MDAGEETLASPGPSCRTKTYEKREFCMLQSNNHTAKELCARLRKVRTIEEAAKLFAKVQFKNSGVKILPDEWENLTLNELQVLEALTGRLRHLVEDEFVEEMPADPSGDDPDELEELEEEDED